MKDLTKYSYSAEYHREYSKKYYLENREKRIAYAKKWNKDNPEKCKEYNRRARAKRKRLADKN